MFENTPPNTHAGQHGLNCILPPHMLESMKLRGDKKIKKMVALLEKNACKYREDRQEMVMYADEQGIAASATSVGGKPKRKVYDGEEKASLPGKLARSEGSKKHGDAAVDEAYNGAGTVYDLYWKSFGRDSLDGAGMELISTVHHRKNYNNAFWNGEQMAYGDGDGRIFKKMTELSIVGHELSHGVVQFSGGLIYEGQSGALNESFADVFGALTVQYKRKHEAHEANWLIGDGILGPDINGDALRSMKAPGLAYSDDILGTDPQPFHMDFYVNTNQDNGGVHINSGIPNHAFYLLSQYMGGCAWEKPGLIWYNTMQQINNPSASFYDWAYKTIEVATDEFGIGSLEAKLTRRAWRLVGIDI